MARQNELCMVDINLRRQEGQDNIPYQKRMEPVVQFINKHDTAVIQDILQRLIQVEHLPCAA